MFQPIEDPFGVLSFLDRAVFSLPLPPSGNPLTQLNLLPLFGLSWAICDVDFCVFYALSCGRGTTPSLFCPAFGGCHLIEDCIPFSGFWFHSLLLSRFSFAAFFML